MKENPVHHWRWYRARKIHIGCGGKPFFPKLGNHAYCAKCNEKLEETDIKMLPFNRPKENCKYLIRLMQIGEDKKNNLIDPLKIP